MSRRDDIARLIAQNVFPGEGNRLHGTLDAADAIMKLPPEPEPELAPSGNPIARRTTLGGYELIDDRFRIYGRPTRPNIIPPNWIEADWDMVFEYKHIDLVGIGRVMANMIMTGNPNNEESG